MRSLAVPAEKKPRAKTATTPARPRPGGDAAKKKRSTAKPGSGTLVIVESPAKASTIKKYLGEGFEVKASVGHVKDLPKASLGIDIEHDFQPV